MSPVTNMTQSNLDLPSLDLPNPDQKKGWRERTGSRLGTLAILGVTAALVMVGAWLVDRPVAAEAGVQAIAMSQAGKGTPPKIGTPAQNFTATTVDGKEVSLAGYKGTAVWLTFGATWCAPCQAEAPDIQAAYVKAKPKGVVVVNLFISEDAATVRDYAGRIGLTFPMIADPDTRVAAAYRVQGIPVHFFIDRSGVLRNIVTGSLNPERMDSELAKIS